MSRDRQRDLPLFQVDGIRLLRAGRAVVRAVRARPAGRCVRPPADRAGGGLELDHAAGARSKPRAQPRRFIDEAAKVLTSPFDAVVQSSNGWVKHGLPAVFALLVYGLGLGYLARYTSVR